MRPLVWPAAGALCACLIVGARLEPPLDVGTWATQALSGEVVLALAISPDDDVVVVGTQRGLHLLHPNDGSSALGATGAVRALAQDADTTWVGTDQGVLSLVDGRLSAGPAGLPEAAIHALDTENGRLLVASDEGVHQLTEEGVLRLWPPPGELPAPAKAVVAARDGVLFAHPDGLALLTGDGHVQLVLPAADVVALGRFGATDAVWAGTRGAPLLARSRDGGRSWSGQSEGIGLSAVHALATSPARPAHHVVGGSGLADGTGNAGTQWSTDDARTWQVEQDRLSNTHVFAVAATQQPVRLALRLRGTDLSASVPLPVSTPRWYAGTNGSGVATMRPDLPALDALARTAPYLRVAEPILLGTLVLGVLLPAYQRLARTRATLRGPPGPQPSTPARSSETDPSNATQQETLHADDQDPATAPDEPGAVRHPGADRLRRRLQR